MLDLQLRELFLRCKAPRTLALCGKKHLACTDDSFSIVDFLREQVAEPSSLVIIQFFDWVDLLRRPVIRIVDAISFKSWELFRFARDILLDLLDELVAEHGQEFFHKPENLGIIENEWLRRLWGGRAGRDTKGKKRSKAPFEYRRAVEIAGRWMDDGAEQRCSCGGSDGFHSEEKVSACGELHDGMCLAHYLLMALRSKAPLEQRLRWRSYARGSVALDAKRKLQLSPKALVSLAQAPKSTVCEPVALSARDLQVATESLETSCCATRPATRYGAQGSRHLHEASPRQDAPYSPCPPSKERPLTLI